MRTPLILALMMAAVLTAGLITTPAIAQGDGKVRFLLVCDDWDCADDLRKDVRGNLFRLVCSDWDCEEFLRRRTGQPQPVIATDQREKKIMLMTPKKKPQEKLEKK